MKNFLYKNININYSDVGKGTVIILLHGYLENISMWDFFIESFSKKNRIISIDLLGHGKTDCIGYVHTMEEQAEMVYSVLKILEIKTAIFIGHSMGGYIALAFAENYPKSIKGLILLNSTAQEDSVEKKANRDRAIKIVKQNYTNFVKLSISNLFSSENQTRLAYEIENVKLEALKTPLQGIIAAQEGMKIRKDREFLLQKSNFPVLLVLGQKDSVLDCMTTSKQIENTAVQLNTLSGGHMSHLENQAELLAVLKDFIKTI